MNGMRIEKRVRKLGENSLFETLRRPEFLDNWTKEKQMCCLANRGYKTVFPVTG